MGLIVFVVNLFINLASNSRHRCLVKWHQFVLSVVHFQIDSVHCLLNVSFCLNSDRHRLLILHILLSEELDIM